MLVFAHEMQERSMVDWRFDLERTFKVMVTPITYFVLWRQREWLVVNANSVSVLDIELCTSELQA